MTGEFNGGLTITLTVSSDMLASLYTLVTSILLGGFKPSVKNNRFSTKFTPVIRYWRSKFIMPVDIVSTSTNFPVTVPVSLS